MAHLAWSFLGSRGVAWGYLRAPVKGIKGPHKGLSTNASRKDLRRTDSMPSSTAWEWLAKIMGSPSPRNTTPASPLN